MYAIGLTVLLLGVMLTTYGVWTQSSFSHGEPSFDEGCYCHNGGIAVFVNGSGDGDGGVYLGSVKAGTSFHLLLSTNDTHATGVVPGLQLWESNQTDNAKFTFSPMQVAANSTQNLSKIPGNITALYKVAIPASLASGFYSLTPYAQGQLLQPIAIQVSTSSTSTTTTTSSTSTTTSTSSTTSTTSTSTTTSTATTTTPTTTHSTTTTSTTTRSTTTTTTTTHKTTATTTTATAGSNVSLNYDEQLGLTYTQNLASLGFNVTAVEQSFNDSYGAGPGYLVTGLSNTGYWYEVGLGWNWPLVTGGHSSGFSLMYEVYDSAGNPVFPADSGLGLLNFSGPVNANDIVNLGLSFSGGNVTMTGYDWNTKASASQNYSAEGATYFAGLPSGVTNANGFFTGLLTEAYHATPFDGNIEHVAFTESSFAFSSAWMWIYEYDSATSQVQFFNQTSSPVSYSNQTQFQSISSDGAMEYSNAFGFVTGPLTSTTTTFTTTASATGTNTITVSSTVTQTSIHTLTTTVPTTTTQTVTGPVSIVTSTATTTAPPTTVTSTAPPSTRTSTQTTTQTATTTVMQKTSSIPGWAYGVMVLLLLIGLAIGYVVKRPPVKQS
jgi:hypothetical protein